MSLTRPEDNFDFKNPGYTSIFRARAERLQTLREDIKKGGTLLASLKVHYKHNPADFINDWGVTYDPRLVERDLPAMVPFVLFPKQRDFVEWLVARWLGRQGGTAEKSRDMGVSWLAITAACAICNFYDGMSVGFGSRKEEYVDRIGSPKALFTKARDFMQNLPAEFTGGWNISKDAPHMRIKFPQTGSYMTGEAGDNIGRGDRTGIYIVDEAAYIERPDLVDAALSQTTNCRIDVSSANGTANSFYKRRQQRAKTDQLFTFHWRSDPRKDDAWYEKTCIEINNPVIVAQEIDINYSASVEGVLIPSAWVQAAIDAHVKLGFQPSGIKKGALDVADQGRDKNAFIGGHGVVINVAEQWSGKGDDIFGTVEKTFELCDDEEIPGFTYDADGLGAGVRGDARVINEMRKRFNIPMIGCDTFKGSGALVNPEREDIRGRKNKDMFVNAKAQTYWALRSRFQKTYRMVKGAQEGNTDLQVHHSELISISSKLKDIDQIATELSQPVYKFRAGDGKMLIDKVPDGASSPNYADAVMIWSKSKTTGLIITNDLLAKTSVRRPTMSHTGRHG